MIPWVRHNWRLKLVSLALATMTWVFVNGITNDRRLVQAVPLEVETRPGTLLLRQKPLLVDVLVRGTRDDMRQVSRNDLAVVLDLSEEEQLGQLTRHIGVGAVRHPRWVQPLEIIPARVTVVVGEAPERKAGPVDNANGPGVQGAR